MFSGLLGDIYSEIGRFEDAEKNYKRAIELAPNNDEAIYGYVNFTMGIGDKKISIDLLKKIIKINKYHSMSYYSLSRLINLEEEKSIKEKIVKFDINVFKDNYNKYNILFSKSIFIID